jgi:hypothetical protein
MFRHKYNNILQFGIIQKNGFILLKSFNPIFDMVGIYFSEFLAILENFLNLN